MTNDLKEKYLSVFKAAFFSEEDALNELVKNEEDLYFEMEIPKGIQYFDLTKFEFTVFDILQMNLEVWDFYKEGEYFKDDDSGINPKRFYQQTQSCIKCLKEKFPFVEVQEVDYAKYIGFLYPITDDDPHFSKEEVDQILKSGVRRLDFDLTEAVISRNINRIKLLLSQGANPNVDIYQDGEPQPNLRRVGMDSSWGFNQHFVDHRNYLNSSPNDYIMDDPYESLSFLYIIASSDRVCRILEEHEVENTGEV